MISIEKAIKIVTRNTGHLPVESIKLDAAVGRVLAENIVADMDLPPFNRSQMDGYAVKAADVTRATTLQIAGESAAGRGWHKTLKKSEAVRIMTGAPVPAGADTIVKVELTREANNIVEINAPVKRGTSIVKKGAEIRRGKIVIKKGERIMPNNIATIAAFGYARVRVAKRPRVAILSTGSEIVDVARKPRRDQIRNSNSPMLSALAGTVNADYTILPPVGDDLLDLKFQISSAVRKCDILIISGGVSVGKYDHTKLALEKLGARVFFDKLRLKPGKPAVFAQLGKTLVFGLPGNPVSAAVTFYLIVRAALLKLQGAKETQLQKAVAILTTDAKADRERDTFLPATLATDKAGKLTATSLRSQGSSDLVGFASAKALIFLKSGEKKNAGDTVEVMVL